ncbi:MAG: hypothetical protein Q8898_15720 [Bacillota bacterium]|nr:hypothetical protein [Bacillota bacterium]
MRLKKPFFSIFPVILAATIIAIPVSLPLADVINQQSAMNQFAVGKLDGERDAKGNPLWFLAGAGCGCFGAGFAFLMKPSPDAQSLVGKSSDYVLGYTEGYKNKGRMKNTSYACAGWAAFVAVYAVAGGFN